MSRRFFRAVAIFGAALLVGFTTIPVNAADASDYYQLRTVSGSLWNRRHAQIFARSAQGSFEYLGSVIDPEWAGQFPLGFSGLIAKNVAVSSDGRSIVYAHNASLAAKLSQKEGGLYRHEHGVGETLLMKASEFSIAATRYPKPLPPDIIVISRLGANQAVSAMGAIFPLLLVGGNKLHQAAFYGDNQAISRFVREAGNSLDALTYWGMTPLEIAVRNGREETAKHLLMLGASYQKNEDSLIYIASAYKRIMVVDELLQRKAPFNYVTKDGNTPLHATLRFSFSSVHDPDRRPNDEATIGVLSNYLKHGADINMRDGNGRTLLHLTLRAPIARYLIASGIDPDAADNEGDTALHHAVAMEIDERHKEGWEERMLPLLEVIASRMRSIDRKNNQGVSPLQRAIQSNHVRTAEYLVARGSDASVEFIHRGLGPRIPGQSIRGRIESIKNDPWWKEKAK